MLGGLARKADVPQGPPSPGEGSPLRHSYVLYIGFPDAYRGAAVPRGCHREFFLVRDSLCQGGVPSLRGAQCAGHLPMVDSAYTISSMPILLC